MLNVAKEKKLYKEYICAYLNPGEKTGIPENQYDIVMCIAGFLGSHLKPEVAEEFCRILKPGAFR